MFAVPKHDPSQARFVINLKPRNANTFKRISPIPDMKGVRSNIASHKRRTKLDFKAAYEPIRLEPDSVPFSGFVTPTGTYVSRVLQQGDTNAPDTMHRVCNLMFSKLLGRGVDVFYDDVFVYSQTYRARLTLLEIFLTTLRHYRFFLSRNKVDFFASRLEALGSIITDEGIEVDPKKWDAVPEWPVPRNVKDVLRFMGTVQWMSDHLPCLSEIAAPITQLTGKVDWHWSPACDAAFDMIKALVPQTLTPLDIAKLESGEEKLFVFSDASILGCGGWIGQGTTIDDAGPLRYHSAKFNPAQRNYHTTDQELLGVLDNCLSFRELILGWDIVVVTDHMPLKTYWDQNPKLTRQHVRLWETLSQFSIVWAFIPGKKNTLADSLSRLAELCADDVWLALPDAQEPPPAPDDLEPFPSTPSAKMTLAVFALSSALVLPTTSPSATIAPVLNPPSARILAAFPSSFATAFVASLNDDTLGQKILADPSAYPSFHVSPDRFVFRQDGTGWQLLVPHGTFKTDRPVAPTFVEAILDHSHRVLGHLSALKRLNYLRRSFWWPTLHRDAMDYVCSCETCARAKSATSKPFGLLHPLPVPDRPWAETSMDFVVGLPPVLYQGALVDSILSVTGLLSRAVLVILYLPPRQPNKLPTSTTIRYTGVSACRRPSFRIEIPNLPAVSGVPYIPDSTLLSAFPPPPILKLMADPRPPTKWLAKFSAQSVKMHPKIGRPNSQRVSSRSIARHPPPLASPRLKSFTASSLPAGRPWDGWVLTPTSHLAASVLVSTGSAARTP
ncbi:hypothetical protein JCM11641_004573 [Rhodosporidiobolus odoratus]